MSSGAGFEIDLPNTSFSEPTCFFSATPLLMMLVNSCFSLAGLATGQQIVEWLPWKSEKGKTCLANDHKVN